MKFIKRKYRYKVGKKTGTGFARIYIQNAIELAAAKFLPGSYFSVKVSRTQITLKVDQFGERKVIKSKKNASIVELTNKEINDFCGDAEFVTVTLRNGKIVISLHISDKQRQAREKVLLQMLLEGRITTASLYSGIGVMAYRLHKGFAELGIRSEILFANELNPIAAEINANFNPIWDKAGNGAVMECDDIETMDFEDLPTNVGLLEIAIPCVGHSGLTSVSNKDLKHPLTGKIFMRTMEAIRIMNPATMLIECTPAFEKSDAFACITDQLTKLGYSFESTMFKGSDFGDFEHRKRFCLFAVSNGIKHLFPRLKDMKPEKMLTRTFGDIMDNVNIDSTDWKEYAHVKARNDMKHLGYRNVLIDANTEHMPAILSSYGAPKSGQPFVVHPINPNLQRMISVREHCYMRLLPAKLQEALCMLAKGTLLGRTRTGKTLAHKFLGNSVSPTPWQKCIVYLFSSFRVLQHSLLSSLETDTLCLPAKYNDVATVGLT